MNDRCPACDLKFEREQGYFLGAMYISYGVALVMITAIAALLWSTTRRADHESYGMGDRAVCASGPAHNPDGTRAVDLS